MRSAASRARGPLDVRLLRLARTAHRPLGMLGTVSVLQAAATVAISLAAAHLVVRLLDGGTWLAALVALAAAFLTRAGTRAILPVLADRVSARVIHAARRRGLFALASRGHTRHAGRGSSTDPATLLSTGLEPLRSWFASYLPALVVAAVLPAGVVLLMLVIDASSALTVLLTLPLVPLFAALIGWATQRQASTQYARGGALAGHFLDVVRGLVTLKLYDRAERQVEEVRTASHRYASATTRVLSVAFLSSTALDLVATVSVGLVAVNAGVRLAGGELDLWPALAVILLAPEAYRPLREAGAQFHESAQASAVMDALDELDGGATNAQTSRTHPSEQQKSQAAPAHGAETGVLEVHDAVVRYPARRTEVALPDLTIEPGELVAVVGPSGSGKTTLLRLLVGAEQPSTGTVRAPRCELVPQRGWLPLARTVREALTADLDGIAPDDASLTAVLADLALALDLRAPLGDDATGVSTGQRQRLAIARAVLRARAVLASHREAVVLLDEPTAHLDTRAEHAVAAVLRELSDAGATIVVTTHRPGLISASDRTITVTPRADKARTAHAAEARDATSIAADGRTALKTPAASKTPANELAETAEHTADNGGPPRPSGLLAGLRRRWRALAPSSRLVLAGLAGALSGLSGIGLTVAASWLVVRAESQPPILTLSIAVVCVRGFAIARPLWRYLERLASHDSALGRLADWRAHVVADLIPQLPGRLTVRRGALLNRVIEDVDARLDGLVRGVVPAGAALGVFTAVAGLLALWHPTALAPLVAALAVTAAVTARTVRRDRRIGSARDLARTELHDAVVAAVESPEELTTQDSALLRATHARGAVAAGLDARASRVDAVAEAGTEVSGGVLALGASLVAAAAVPSVPPETVGVLVLGSLAVVETLSALVPALRTRSAGAVAGERLDRLHQTRLGVASPPERDCSPEQDETLARSRAEDGGLRTTELAVGWDHRTVRSSLDLAIAPGETLEISWPSGAGKSTLAATLAGLVTARGGTFTVSSHPAEILAGFELRRRLTVAGDADHVFATTLRENLRLARSEATDRELLDALRRAYLADWFAGLRDGLDTWFDSGGHALSGGERRRLVLTRALLRNPDVLILDEPEAGIDPATAADLLAKVRAEAHHQARAVLVMTHLPRTHEPEHVGVRLPANSRPSGPFGPDLNLGQGIG